MKKWGYWTKDNLQSDALKYLSKGEWKKNSGHAYTKARENGWLEELTIHMTPQVLPKGYWSKENILKDALKYNTKRDWENSSPSAHTIACKNGWLIEATKHMVPSEKYFPPIDPLLASGLRKCYTCKKTKELKNFNKNYCTREGYLRKCKKCSGKYGKMQKMKMSEKTKTKNKKSNRIRMAKQYNTKGRNNMLKYTYGISLDDYHNLHKSQNGTCKICGIEQDDLNRNLNVDHDHKTGQIRGLLCCKCNMGLGHFNDSEILLMAAINYLKKL